MGWKPRTLADDAGVENHHVRCECGRRVPADMMVEAAALPAELRMAAARRPLTRRHPPAYLCDGCREWLALSGRVRRSDLALAFGAPPEVVERAREKEGRSP